MKKINLYLSMVIMGLLIVSCTKQETATYARFMFRNDGADLAVEVNGNLASKTFILLLHGGPGGSGTAYNGGRYSEILEEKYAIVYMDQRGNGASQGSYSESDLTLTQNSKDVYALTKFLKLKYGDDISLFLLGHSWGGITSSHVLVNTAIQEELKGWIEVDGVNDFAQNNLEAIRLFKTVGEAQVAKNHEVGFWQEVLDSVKVIDTLNITFADELYLNQKGFEAEQKLKEIERPEDNSTAGYSFFNSPINSLSILTNNSLVNGVLNNDSKENPTSEFLYKVKIPAQFLWGKYDFVVPPALGIDAFNKVGSSNKKLVFFEHSGHSPMINEPEKFTNEIIGFISLYE
ncbi:hypothetical protein DNU06_14145 [Putridiphycobacter roseus]|uniref:Serine aminopeptidase S33 domain-containing protein n=1 Tax=Putridiphycobacter roseus TaxID=2219161 RepID=A0A2W1NDX6_9FLAO|nr:alpha/beta hydrolase [Putridiphycobacter roseus]PZE16266.1 hypothetical protein DNU06_14145 [Putridiphycobacter roseus]